MIRLSKNTKELIQYGFAAVVMFMLFVLLGLLLFRDIPDKNKDVLNIAVGVALGWGSMILAYFFGSSKGSSDKNDIIRNSTTNINNQATDGDITD